MVYYHLTKKSTNAKVGKMATTTASQRTCEQSDCALLKSGGCYAGPDGKGGPMAWFWDKVTRGVAKNVTSLKEHLDNIRDLPDNSSIRLFQAGQHSHTKKGKLNRLEIKRFMSATKHLNTISYVHSKDADTIKWANDQGYPLIASIDNLSELENYDGCPTSHVVSANLNVRKNETLAEWRKRTLSDFNLLEKTFKKHNRRMFKCPAQYTDTTCEKCMACANIKPDQSVIFMAHGARKNKIA